MNAVQAACFMYQTIKNKKPCKMHGFLIWGEIWDSNPRPPGPQPGAITSLANPTIDGVP